MAAAARGTSEALRGDEFVKWVVSIDIGGLLFERIFKEDLRLRGERSFECLLKTRSYFVALEGQTDCV